MESVKVTTFKEYQVAAMRTCKESSKNMQYMVLEVISEAGEMIGKVAKVIRDDNGVVTAEKRTAILHELGDILWGIAGVCTIGKVEVSEDSFKQTDESCREHMSNLINDTKDGLFFMSLSTTQHLGRLAVGCLISEEIDIEALRCVHNCIAVAAMILNSSLQEVAQINIDKLTDRYNRNMIGGSGDNR